MSSYTLLNYVTQRYYSSWAFYTPLFGTLINLGLLFWQRHSHPWNLLLLSTFTLLEAFTLGIVVAFYDNKIVIQALLITLGVFIGLTLFTFQSKYDFEGMGPFLFGGLIALSMCPSDSLYPLPTNDALSDDRFGRSVHSIWTDDGPCYGHRRLPPLQWIRRL